MKTPEQTMYPHDVQLAIIRQLITYETLLKPKYKLRIDRFSNGDIFTYIVKNDSNNTPAWVKCWQIKSKRLHSMPDIDAELHIVWSEIDPKFKIQN